MTIYRPYNRKTNTDCKPTLLKLDPSGHPSQLAYILIDKEFDDYSIKIMLFTHKGGKKGYF